MALSYFLITLILSFSLYCTSPAYTLALGPKQRDMFSLLSQSETKQTLLEGKDDYKNEESEAPLSSLKIDVKRTFIEAAAHYRQEALDFMKHHHYESARKNLMIVYSLDPSFTISQHLEQIGDLAFKKKKYRQAFSYYQYSFKYIIPSEHKKRLLQKMKNIGDLAFKKKKYLKSLHYYTTLQSYLPSQAIENDIAMRHQHIKQLSWEAGNVALDKNIFQDAMQYYNIYFGTIKYDKKKQKKLQQHYNKAKLGDLMAQALSVSSKSRQFILSKCDTLYKKILPKTSQNSYQIEKKHYEKKLKRGDKKYFQQQRLRYYRDLFTNRNSPLNAQKENKSLILPMIQLLSQELKTENAQQGFPETAAIHVSQAQRVKSVKKQHNLLSFFAAPLTHETNLPSTPSFELKQQINRLRQQTDLHQRIFHLKAMDFMHGNILTVAQNITHNHHSTITRSQTEATWAQHWENTHDYYPPIILKTVPYIDTLVDTLQAWDHQNSLIPLSDEARLCLEISAPAEIIRVIDAYSPNILPAYLAYKYEYLDYLKTQYDLGDIHDAYRIDRTRQWLSLIETLIFQKQTQTGLYASPQDDIIQMDLATIATKMGKNLEELRWEIQVTQEA